MATGSAELAKESKLPAIIKTQISYTDAAKRDASPQSGSDNLAVLYAALGWKRVPGRTPSGFMWVPNTPAAVTTRYAPCHMTANGGNYHNCQ